MGMQFAHFDNKCTNIGTTTKHPLHAVFYLHF